MPITMCHPRLEQILAQRCFLLFLALLALLVVMPYLGDTPQGRMFVGLLNVIILMTAVAAVKRSILSLVIAILLGLPALVFQFLANRIRQRNHVQTGRFALVSRQYAGTTASPGNPYIPPFDRW